MKVIAKVVWEMDGSGMAAGVIDKIHFKGVKPNAQAYCFPWPPTLMLALDLRLWLGNGVRAPSLQVSPLVPLGPLGQFCDLSVCILPWLTVRQIELEEFYGSGKTIMKVELLIHNTNKHWALITNIALKSGITEESVKWARKSMGKLFGMKRWRTQVGQWKWIWEILSNYPTPSAAAL